MDREILFRAKRFGGGEWVEGDLNHCLLIGAIHICRMEDNLSTTTHRVDPKTVCQYTSLTDKNGRKIFEGDIVKVRHADGQEDYAEIAEVSWDDKNACFSPWNWQYQCDGCDLYCEIQSIEVIGNIFDNPELLKGGTE